MKYENKITELTPEMKALEEKTMRAMKEYYLKNQSGTDTNEAEAILVAMIAFAVGSYRNVFGTEDAVELLYHIADHHALEIEPKPENIWKH